MLGAQGLGIAGRGGIHWPGTVKKHTTPGTPEVRRINKKRKGTVVHGFIDELLDYITGACLRMHRKHPAQIISLCRDGIFCRL